MQNYRTRAYVLNGRPLIIAPLPLASRIWEVSTGLFLKSNIAAPPIALFLAPAIANGWPRGMRGIRRMGVDEAERVGESYECHRWRQRRP